MGVRYMVTVQAPPGSVKYGNDGVFLSCTNACCNRVFKTVISKVRFYHIFKTRRSGKIPPDPNIETSKTNEALAV